MKLTTTLNKIRACSPCTSGWKTLLTYLGKTEADDAEINLLTVLESNGVPDMLWCLRATTEDSKRIASQLAIEFAEQALPIFEKRKPDDNRPRAAIQAARDFLDGTIGIEELRKAHADAAYAYAAYADAAYAYAAYADADADADADAYAAYASYAYAAYAADAAYAYAYAYAADAAYAYADAGKARAKQAEIIKMILE